MSFHLALVIEFFTNTQGLWPGSLERIKPPFLYLNPSFFERRCLLYSIFEDFAIGFLRQFHQTPWPNRNICLFHLEVFSFLPRSFLTHLRVFSSPLLDCNSR